MGITAQQPSIINSFYIRLPNDKKIWSMTIKTCQYNLYSTKHHVYTDDRFSWFRFLTERNKTYYWPDQKALMERRQAYGYELYRANQQGYSGHPFEYNGKMSTQCEEYCPIVKDRF